MQTLRKMRNFRRGLSVLLAVLILFGPEIRYLGIERASAQPAGVNPPRTSTSLKPLVEALMSATADMTDTDGDGLPDSVELVIGTDPNETDSDFDRLDDYWEVDNDLDPMDPDSNFDGLPDYYEVQDANSLDADGDGISNAWDYDNDGDAVNDGVDLSPFAALDVKESFHFDITTNGNPAYMTFQLRPRNKEHLKLFGQSWDWPDGDHEGSVQDWDNSKEDVSVFPILQLSVNVAPDANEVILNGIVVDGNTVSVPLMPVTEHGNIVAFAGRMLYPTATPSNLTIDAELIWKVVGKNDPNSSVLGEETLLVTYKDGFSLTGATVEESYGTDAGLFYSPDVNQVVAANLLMAYEFLRNSANHVADMPAVLDANNIDVEHQVASFAHRDAALVSMANDMIPAGLDSLPTDQNLPIISILEDRSASRELSEFEPVSDNSFSVDLTTEPVMTTKTLKTSWYNTSDRQAMETGDVMAEILELGLNETTSYSLMTLMLYWNTGEQSLEGAGIPPTDPGDDFELIPEVVEDIAGGVLSGLELLYREGLGLAGLEAYQSAKLLHSRGWSLATGEESLADLARMHEFKKFKTFVTECDRIQDSSKFFKNMDMALEGLDAVALFADAGFAVYSVVSLSQMSDLSGIAFNNALMQVTMEYFYNCMLFAIGAIPYVGWIIAIAVELSDLLGDWSDDFVDCLADGFSDVDYVVTPDVNMVGDPNIIMDDKDDNGLDVGDRIEFKSRLKGTIYGTEYYWNLVSKSEIDPYYKIFGPGGSSTITGSPYSRAVGTCWDTWYLPISGSQWTWDKPAGWRAQEYESDVWIEPGTAMPNFPVYVQLNAVYEIWYAYSWFSWYILEWGWQYRVSQQCGQSALGGFTIYFDVMPANISDFAEWRGITPLDNDGLSDGMESSVHSTNPVNGDSDGDALSDGAELEMRLNPLSDDTDNDGVPDGTEIEEGTNPWNGDSDHDGVPDGQDDPDNVAPDVNNAHPNKKYLWPANNKFVEIAIEGVIDPDGDPVQIAVTRVTSDEPSCLGKDSKHKPDAYISENGALFIRAECEHRGGGNGRVYEISFVAGDIKGGITTGKVRVMVPRRTPTGTFICQDDGQHYDVLHRSPLIRMMRGMLGLHRQVKSNGWRRLIGQTTWAWSLKSRQKSRS